MKIIYEKLCITVQLSHHPYVLGSGDISQVIYLDPLDLAIEASLGEEGEVGKILFQANELLVRSRKDSVRNLMESGVTFPC